MPFLCKGESPLCKVFAGMGRDTIWVFAVLSFLCSRFSPLFKLYKKAAVFCIKRRIWKIHLDKPRRIVYTESVKRE